MSSSGQVPPTKRKQTDTYKNWMKRNDGSLKSSGTAFIRKLVKTWREHQDKHHKINIYMNKLLHSIFFLGHIHKARLPPTAFFESQEVMYDLKRRFPQAFNNYKCPPHQTPFSILLDLAVRICRCEGEEERGIKTFLLSFLEALKLPPKIKGESNYTNYYTLEATVIAVCYNETPGALRPEKYYGASLSCRGEREKNIVINWSCLKVWHDYVSYAVLSFRHDEQGNGIRFPVSVKCRAFYRNHQTNCYEDRRPCKNCGDLFSLSNPETDRNDFPYGNCAETECLSKLIFNDQDVRSNMILGIYCTRETLKGLREKAGIALEHGLKA
ncbi:uncharacterized protein LOC120043492 [Salvelinus namaycush]|uniref:Uncharacterized protein LOC120043492 n=1 Tax=Salvelinus namaycush TaxID=8040 RepID=A0A8U0U868_SALNM|nr:uncharacterized protein LOC120043492 [Salvelinus namaycush]